MARPLQTGLSYFPLDVSIDQDDKIALIEADYGMEGFSIVIKLLMKIYSNGYFYHWGEKEQKLFSRKVDMDLPTIIGVVEAGLRWGLFNQSLFDNYGILTSRGIQKRYFEASNRRKQVQVMQEYLLISASDQDKYSNLEMVSLHADSEEERVDLTAPAVNADSNSGSSEVMSSETIQSKENQNKGKENEIISKHLQGTAGSELQEILEYYETNFGSVTTYNQETLEKWRKDLSAEVLIEAMKRAKMKDKSFAYAKSILKDFKLKNVKTLKDLEKYDQDFKKSKQKAAYAKPPVRVETLPKWARPDYQPEEDEPLDEETVKELREKLEEIRAAK